MFKKAAELYNKVKYIFEKVDKKWIETQNVSENLSIDLYLDDLPPMPPLAGDEEVKLITRLPTLLAHIKAGNNSYKFKNEIRQILHLLYQHNKTTKKVYKNLIKSI